MGILKIEVSGSFPITLAKAFMAQEAGHAVAVDNAIRYLQGTVLPASILNDKSCRQDGIVPNDGFEEADKRGLLR